MADPGATSRYAPGSHRDRESRVFRRDGGWYRALSPRAAADVSALLATRFFREEVAAGRVVATEPAPIELAPEPTAEPWAAVVRHEAIPFVSYPFEWTFEMLRDAALLQLDLHLRALEEGFTLKDASPYNGQFRGSRPVFIDVGSFERVRPGEPWAGYRQFCQLYLYPLLLGAWRGVPHQPWLRGALDGIRPEEFARLVSLRDLFRPGVFVHGLLHARLSARHAGSDRDVRAELRAAGFNEELTRATLAGLRRLVERLPGPERRSEWSHYVEESCPYAPEDRSRREAFVRDAIDVVHPARVWDVGCNTGAFSRIAAERADVVVALDPDAGAVERLYRALRADGDRRVLPLVAGAAETEVAAGWRGAERPSMRERGAPDLVLALALVHHLAISSHLPVAEITAWLAALGPEAIVEFVGPGDPMVRRLLRNRADRFPDLVEARFEAELSRRFRVERRLALRGGGRVLYHARRRE